MRFVYVVLLLFAASSASVVAFYTSFASVLRLSAVSVNDASVFNLYYAPIAVLGFLGVCIGLTTFLSSRPIFTQVAGVGAAAIVLTCVAMILEVVLKGYESSFMSVTLGNSSYGLPLAFWIALPLLFNVALLLFAPMKLAKVF